MSQDNTKLPCREEICGDGCVLALRGGQRGLEKIWLGLILVLPHLMLPSSKGITGVGGVRCSQHPRGGLEKRYKLPRVLEENVLLDGAGHEKP